MALQVCAPELSWLAGSPKGGSSRSSAPVYCGPSVPDRPLGPQVVCQFSPLGPERRRAPGLRDPIDLARIGHHV